MSEPEASGCQIKFAISGFRQVMFRRRIFRFVQRLESAFRRGQSRCCGILKCESSDFLIAIAGERLCSGIEAAMAIALVGLFGGGRMIAMGHFCRHHVMIMGHR